MRVSYFLNAHQLDFNQLCLSFLNNPVVRNHDVALGLCCLNLSLNAWHTLNPTFESLTLLSRISALRDSVDDELLNTSLLDGWIST